MGVALNTAGVTVGYAVEASAGTRPTTNTLKFLILRKYLK